MTEAAPARLLAILFTLVIPMALTSCSGGSSSTGGNGGGGGGGSTAQPSLKVNVSSGSFTPGQQNAIYAITISNNGDAATSGTITVTDPPTGFAVSAIAGNNWSCTVSTVSCTSSAAVAPGSSYAPIVVAGSVVATAGQSVAIPVQVSGGGLNADVNGNGSIPVAPAVADTTPLTQITLVPWQVQLSVGGTAQLTAIGTYQDGVTQTLTSGVTWTSTKATVASVSSSGLATAVAVGKSTVTATIGKIQGSATISVTVKTAPQLSSIAISPTSATAAVGSTIQFHVIGHYSDNSTRDLTSKAAWASTANALVNGVEAPVAAVSNRGLATALASGSTNIVAGLVVGSKLLQVAAQLTVTPPVLQSIAVLPGSTTLAKGSLQQFYAVGTFSDGTTESLTGSVVWGSTDGSVALIGSNSGGAIALAAGTTTITAALNGVTGEATLTVPSVQLVSIQVTAAAGSIAAGTGDQFFATGTYSDGSTRDLTASVLWGSSDPAVALIDDTGQATGITPGTVTITASIGSVSGSATLTVTTAQCTSVSVSPANPSVAAGAIQTFTAQCSFSDGSMQDVSGEVIWSSTNGTVATIDDSATTVGSAFAIAPGTTTIDADYITPDATDVQGSATLAVTANQGWIINLIITAPASDNGDISVGVNLPVSGTNPVYCCGVPPPATYSGGWDTGQFGLQLEPSNPPGAIEGNNYDIVVVGGSCAVISGAEGTLGKSVPTAYVVCE
jgi:uncharacterized protein YjdB